MSRDQSIMKLSLSTILSLSVFLSSICPSAVNHNYKNNNAAPSKTSFSDLPMEIKEMIFSYAPDAYDSFFRAFREMEGCPRIEMYKLMRVISEKVPTWGMVNEAAHMALRLSSPVPLDPENPDITKIAPSSILKWLRYLRARSRTVKYYEYALYYFARSPDFSEWYQLWTEEEKKKFCIPMALALIFAGKIDEAFEILDVKSLIKSWLNPHDSELLRFYFRTPFSRIVFAACLRDEPDYLQKVLTELKKYELNVDPSNIFKFSVSTKAMKIIKTYKYTMANASRENTNIFFITAINTKDDKFFKEIFNLCRMSPAYGVNEALLNAPIFRANQPGILPFILDQVDINTLSDQEIVTCFGESIYARNITGYKMLFKRVNKASAAKMTVIAPQLVTYALQINLDDFIKHLAIKGGVPHNVILRNLRNMPVRLRNDIPLDYLLTAIEGELPITGSYEFLENELITFLIEGYDTKGCEIALSKNAEGKRKYPFVRVTPEHVPLAMEKCPLCLLYFPSNLVNDFIEENPECFTKNEKVFYVLTSALDGKPRFAAMRKYWNVEYLQELIVDERSDEFDLLNQYQSYWFDGKTIESMFGLLEFPPELNSALNKRLIIEKRTYEGAIKYDFPQPCFLEFLLSKKNDGSPQFPTFQIDENVLFQREFHFSFPNIFKSYEGNLLYGISLTSKDENGKECHLLYRIPEMKDASIAQTCVDLLLENDGCGNFMIKGINEDDVRRVAEFYADRIRWYSEMLLKKLDTLKPPFVARE